MKHKTWRKLATGLALVTAARALYVNRHKLGNRLYSPSTRAFWQEAQRISGYSRFDWLHGYVYGRWPYFYISMGIKEHWLARLIERFLPQSENGSAEQSWADSYHGKVVPLEAATQLVSVGEDIDLGDLEQVIPYPRARDLVFQHPDHIVALECPCRAARENPCLPLDVCLIVGEPFASFILEHHPARSRWITPDEAVDILKAEDERGHVHHAFFKDAMLGRFYAICNCCACCCGAMGAHQTGTPMLASSGYVAQVAPDLCAACAACADVCQFAAIGVDNGTAAVDWTACMGCGVCVAHCVTGALSLARDPAKGEPLEIQQLIASVSR